MEKALEQSDNSHKVELLMRDHRGTGAKMAELALFGQVIQVEVIHDEPEDDYNNEVPD